MAYSTNPSRPTRILVFNCTADHPPLALLAHVHATICEQLKLFSDGEDPRSFFHHVIFCTNASYADGTFKDGACSFALSLPDRMYI